MCDVFGEIISAPLLQKKLYMVVVVATKKKIDFESMQKNVDLSI